MIERVGATEAPKPVRFRPTPHLSSQLYSLPVEIGGRIRTISSQLYFQKAKRPVLRINNFGCA
jgi:hypothetical protein